jgi:hypothetical protein
MAGTSPVAAAACASLQRSIRPKRSIRFLIAWARQQDPRQLQQQPIGTPTSPDRESANLLRISEVSPKSPILNLCLELRWHPTRKNGWILG